MAYDQRHQPVIESLKRELHREENHRADADKRIFEIKLELAEFGIELPLEG